ncbi:hypothetical protein M9H77_11051 [Catharanthus roseus]|uniref:Uncharacterized protein n=1 Tax=Catharanthus roseus TaxID=4058 RepID=A0ACC0BDH2_CATRO|nr:hypothetical protein M9H77_11051 [Catharanthus roseus]
MVPLEEGDSIFGYKDEINLDSQVCPRWQHHHHHHHKFWTRKPKYLNRIQLVMFGITPSYSIEKDGEEEENTCIIRVHGGPPYEDIAFKIVNNEWEYSKKKGFKCTFERVILHLFFNFKRFRYRR